MRVAQTTCDRIEGQIEQRIQGITLALETMLSTLDERYNYLLRRQDANRLHMAEKAGHWREYETLRKAWEQEERVYDALFLRMQQERIDAQISGVPSVRVIDKARPAPIPHRTSQPLDVGLMAAGAFVSLSGLALRRTGGGHTAPPGPAAGGR